MPPLKLWTPKKLEDYCISAYISYLKDETDVIFHLRAYANRSLLLKHVNPDTMFMMVDHQLVTGIPGILQDIVRKKMSELIIQDLHNLAFDAIKTMTNSRSFQIISEKQIAERAANRVSVGGRLSPPAEDGSGAASSSSQSASGSFAEGGSCRTGRGQTTDVSRLKSGSSRLQGTDEGKQTGAGNSSSSLNVFSTFKRTSNLSSNYRSLPMFQLLQIVLNSDVKVLDFSKNREWVETEEMNDICRILWKIIGEKCTRLEKFVIPKELTYSSTLNSIIVNGSHLTQLTLKRNIPNNMFLHEIGRNCPKLKELDIAGAEIVNDFGAVCLLYADPEQIFLKCWHRERTVGQVRRSLRAFPHPHFDKQIPDQQDPQPRMGKSSSGGNYLYLKKTFHESLRSDTIDTGDWERLPIAFSLQKLRLENTKVKGDGASVVLETCPNIYSLGYLVFAAAGLKQVFGYEEKADTKFTEIFYRGPSDQKLSTIANCCPNLETMFLGSNNPRTLVASVFKHWKKLTYLTLENIFRENIMSCLEEVGDQLKGLKIQCKDFDLSDIAALCPKLRSLIIQKETPYPVINPTRTSKHKIFSQLEHVEVSCTEFSKQCMAFIVKNAVKLKSLKVLYVPKLSRGDMESWLSNNPLQYLQSLVIFKLPQISCDTILWLLEELPAIREFGDLHSTDFAKQPEVRKLQQELKRREWDVTLIDSSQGVDTEERDFSKLQNLHWFYLTPSEGYRHK